MRAKILLFCAVLFGAGACELPTVSHERSSGIDAEASFDGIGGTLGSGYGAPMSPDSLNQPATASADTTGRIGGTLGSGY